MYEDYNDAVFESGRRDAPHPAEPEFHGGAPRRRKKRLGLKIAALCLACAVAGGATGTGVTMYLGSRGESSTTLTTGTHDPISVTTTTVNNGQTMTPAEIYAAYVASTVGITTEVTETNIFGQTVSTPTAGSGFIVSEDGYILTNQHVIDGATTVTVSLYDGSSYNATIVGSDEDSDIAVLKIDATGLTPVVLGDSDNVIVGESVTAIGNPLGELTFTYTGGMISEVNRSVTIDGATYNMLQTDCAINGGNSGGPLFNSYGEVIGIVSAKYEDTGVEGLGFAIPLNDILPLVEDIMENGYVTGKAYMGITPVTVTQNMARQYSLTVGVYVSSVESGSAAEKAGIQKGDVITKLGDTDITTASELNEAKKDYKAGDTTTVTIVRSGETLALSITFDEEVPEELTEDTSTQSETSSTQDDSLYNPWGGWYSNPFGSDGSSSDIH
ncbi:MAG TPA: trypsin-like peptidase domain-containing protein [Oscillospiraceae bacterium]|nr:trypsin-like peptidase domain-containing protein [Oscillospiraceae bacterium]